MKRVILASLILYSVSTLLVSGQAIKPFQVQWHKSFGGTNFESPGGRIAVAQDGGYAVLSLSESGVSGTKETTNYGRYDAWLVRLDSSGNKIWERNFGGASEEGVRDLKATADNGWIFVGESYSVPSGNKTSPNYGEADYWIVRLDSEGNKLWEKSIGGNRYDEAVAVLETDNGDFIIAGYSYSETNQVKTAPRFGLADIWILRLSAQGDVLWQTSYGGASQDWPYAIAPYGTNGFVIGAASASPPGGNKESPTYEGSDFWIIAIDHDGNKLWERSYGGDNSDELRNLRQTSDGGFIAYGSTGSGVSGNKTTPLAFPYADCWLLRLNGSGEKIWERTFGHEGTDFPYGVMQTVDGGFVVTGFEIPSGDWTIRFDGDGNQVWEHRYDLGYSSGFADIQNTQDGGLIAVSAVPSLLQSHDLLVVKLAADALTAPQLALQPFSPDFSTPRLLLRGIPGRAYVVERSEDFIDWLPFATNTLSSNTMELLDSNSAQRNRFYRAKMLP
jgi:hypothetical protein